MMLCSIIQEGTVATHWLSTAPLPCLSAGPLFPAEHDLIFQPG